jgi:UDP:flavonoid glycosyltransferase YjiC (YdhE family)
MVVSHGGSGTTFGALRAGIPVVIVPLFADQFVNGSRVAEAGAGVVIDRGVDGDGRRRPLNQADAPRITEAIERVRSQPTYRDQAGRIAAEMAATPTVGALFDELASV